MQPTEGDATRHARGYACRASGRRATRWSVGGQLAGRFSLAVAPVVSLRASLAASVAPSLLLSLAAVVATSRSSAERQRAFEGAVRGAPVRVTTPAGTDLTFRIGAGAAPGR